MFQIGPQELLLILVVALLVVGPRRLPELGRSIGRGIREIRKAQEEVRKTIQVNLDDDSRPTFDDARDRPQPGPDGKGAAAAAAAAATDDAREISRTLGRGLAEIRRARREVERSFRVDIDSQPPSRSRASGAEPTRRDGAAAPATGPTPKRSEVEDSGSGEDTGSDEETGGQRETPQPT
jgi:sec-independent protein translocase protein TatA